MSFNRYNKWSLSVKFTLFRVHSRARLQILVAVPWSVSVIAVISFLVALIDSLVPVKLLKASCSLASSSAGKGPARLGGGRRERAIISLFFTSSRERFAWRVYIFHL